MGKRRKRCLALLLAVSTAVSCISGGLTGGAEAGYSDDLLISAGKVAGISVIPINSKEADVKEKTSDFGNTDTNAGADTVSESGMSAGEDVEGEPGMSAGSDADGEPGMSAGSDADGEPGISAGTGTDNETGISAGTGTDNETGISAGTGTNGEAGMSAGTGTDGEAGMSAGAGTEGEPGMSAGTGTDGEPGTSAEAGTGGETAASAGTDANGEPGISAGSFSDGEPGISAGTGLDDELQDTAGTDAAESLDTDVFSELTTDFERDEESDTADEALSGEEPETENETESETENEMESDLYKVYLMQDALYTLEVSQNRYEYEQGETVYFTAEASSGVQIVSADILEVLDPAEQLSGFSGAAEEISDFLDLSGREEEPDLLLVSGEAAEAVRETREAGLEMVSGEEAEAEKDTREAGLETVSGEATEAVKDTRDAEPGSVFRSGETEQEEETAAYSFVMPDSDVIITCDTEMIQTAAVFSGEEDDIPEVDHAELIVDTVPGPAQYPQQLVNGSSKLWTSVKHVRLFDSSGNLIDTCIAYCMQPSLSGPASGTNVPESQIEELETGTKDRTLAKILYYLYGGPAWGREVTDQSGNTLDYRELMEAIGCATDGNCLAVTHLVLGYVYDNSRWNYGCNAMGNPVADALNTQGQTAIRELAEKIRNMPDPKAEFSSSTSDSYYENGQVRSETITYHANADNAAVVKLPAGISLYNETSGTVQTGTVTISGGDKFHLLANGISGNGSYVFTTTFATDFSAYKISFPGKQDLGFSYTAGDKKLSLSVEWVNPLIPVSVKKTSANQNISDGNSMYSLAGAVFKLYQGSTEKASFTTDENGNTAAVEVEPGTYVLKETVTPKGFKKAKDQTVTIDPDDGTKVISITDEPVAGTCSVLLKKVISGGVETDISKGGAQFRMEFYGSETASGTPLKTWVFETDSSGIIQLTSRFQVQGDTLYGDGILPLGTLKVTEIRAPEGFCLDETPQTVQITQSGETAVFSHSLSDAVFQFSDQLVFGGLRLKKEDRETGTAQGDASLAGAEFAVYNASDYAVIRADDTSTKYQKGQEVCRMITDRDGIAQTPEIRTDGTVLQLLQAGTYTVKEVKAPKGYVMEEYSRTITITENGQILDISDTPARDRVIRFDLTIQKFRDTSDREEPGENLMPLEGIEFGIYLETTGEKILSITTGADGTATTRSEDYPFGRLPYGRYVVKEEKYPVDVVPVSDFIVEGTEDGKEYKGIYKNDVPVEEYLELRKTDAETGKPILTGAVFQILDDQKNVLSFKVSHPKHQVITDFTTDENGVVTLPERLPYGTYYLHEVKAPSGYLRGEDLKFQVTVRNSWENTITITYENTPVKGRIRLTKLDKDTEQKLSGAAFQVFAAEDIITGDGTVRLAVDELADTITVGEDGIGYSKELYPGNYYLIEKKAPEGYCLDTTRHEAVLDYEDQDTAVVYADVTVKNKPTKLYLFKKDTDGEVLSGITFEINGRSFRTDGEGRIQAEKLLPGIYTIRETETLPGYVLDPVPHYVTVDEEGFIYESDPEGRNLSADGEKTDTCTLLWENDYTRWDFSKTDVNGDGELPGAKMSILDQEGEEVCSWISGKEEHRISKLPAGDYTLVEKTAPAGFVTAAEMPFTVTETGIVQKLTMVDKQLLVKKVNPDGSDVAGAVLEIRDMEGNVLDTWETDGSAHPASGLKVGDTCILAEIRAPEGYVEGAPVTFTVTDDGVNQVVLMVNKQVCAYKIDSNVSILAGAQMEVRRDSLDGALVDQWISDGSEHAIRGLQAGYTYVLAETRAPEGYALASPITFTVQDNGENDVFSMVNKQVWMSKQSVTGSEEIPGASIRVFDQNGNLMDSWISGEEPHPISNLTVGETYILHEEAAAEGYVTATDITFTVADDYTDQHVVLKDKQVMVSKQEITGKKEIGGAVLTVLDQEGCVVDSWTSIEGEKHPISGLAVNHTYVLREEIAPDGYVRAEEIIFTVEDDFSIQVVEMLDDVTKVEISKTDITTGEPLPGAELVIRSSDGTEIERWITGREPYYIEMLPTGDYTLTELTAPEGYEVAETVTFTVEETGEIQRVEMKDRPKTPSVPSGDVPQTGDRTKAGGWLLLMFLSAACALQILKRKSISNSSMK